MCISLYNYGNMLLNSVIYAILAGILPSFIWLFFWTREDTKSHQPRSLIVFLFIGGMLAVPIAGFSEQMVQAMVHNQTICYVIWAAIEEILKFTAVYVIAVHVRANNEPVDIMIYCIVAALGFAALENTLFIVSPLLQGPVSISQSLIMGNMRFIGATLVHVVSSATIGFMLGYVFFQGKIAKFFAFIIGLASAIAIHTGFNLSIANADPNDTLRAFAWIWGGVVLLIVLFEEVKAVHMRNLATA